MEQPCISSNTTPFFIELNDMHMNQHLHKESPHLRVNHSTSPTSIDLSATDKNKYLSERNNEQHSASINVHRSDTVPKQEFIDETIMKTKTRRSTEKQQSSRCLRNREQKISHQSPNCCNCCCFFHRHNELAPDQRSCCNNFSKCDNCHECVMCHHCKCCCKCGSSSDSDSDCESICDTFASFFKCCSSICSMCDCD